MFLKHNSFIRFCCVALSLFGFCRSSFADTAVATTLEHQLFDAIWHSDGGENALATVQTLIKKGVNVNAVEDREIEQGQTPLMVASYAGETSIVSALLAAGAKVNAQSHVKYSVGMTPLMWSVIGSGFDKPNTTALLLRHGANPEAREEHGRSALMLAGAEGSSESIMALIKGGARVNGTNAAGETALMYTAESGHFENIAAFIHNGADVNKQEKDGRTPLMAVILAPYDAQNKQFTSAQVNAVKLLLASGANIKASDVKNMTPLAYAIEQNETIVINLLHSAGAAK